MNINIRCIIKCQALKLIITFFHQECLILTWLEFSSTRTTSLLTSSLYSIYETISLYSITAINLLLLD